MPRGTPADAKGHTDACPDVFIDPSANDVLDVMTRAVFQAGVTWAQIARHWDAYRIAFSRFEPAIVAHYGEADVERILAQPGVLRSPRKVKAAIVNAQKLREVIAEFGSFHNYAASRTDYAALAKDINRRFSFMGAMNAWYLLFRLGEPVPRFEDWVTTIPGDHPRMREMVERARASGTSRECDR
jgi:hypothetical protein